MRINNIEAAIFDMDGTLVNSLTFWDYFWGSLGKKYLDNPSFRPDKKTDKKIRTMSIRDAMMMFSEHYNLGMSGDELGTIAEDMCKEYYLEEVDVKKGVIELLDFLYARDVKMCVASATSMHLLNVIMNKHGLSKYFDKIFSCAEIGKGKDCPDVFLAAHEYLGTKKENTWVFEDSAVAIETAHNAGFPTVGIYDAFSFPLDGVMDSVTEYIAAGEDLSDIITRINKP